NPPFAAPHTSPLHVLVATNGAMQGSPILLTPPAGTTGLPSAVCYPLRISIVGNSATIIPNVVTTLPPGKTLADYVGGKAFWDLNYEGVDADNVRSYRGIYTPQGLAAAPVLSDALHFTVNLSASGERRENWL